MVLLRLFQILVARRPASRSPGLLVRLGRNRGGNVLAIMAAALVPLAGMVGGGIDVARMYILKTRLQHACDAGALAGRKTMGGGTWAFGSYRARTLADQFFDNNFAGGSFGSTNLSRVFTENGGKVSGIASADLPMTLMRVLGQTTRTIAVSCDADMRLPNTDVMFVLDTTGSMEDTPTGDSMTKMASLKIAVKCFYEIVARLDTDASCTTGTPSGGTGSQVQIRFGFVPYAVNVNVGKLLKPEWFRDLAPYQTRAAQYVAYTYVNKNPQNDWSAAETYGNVSSSACNAKPIPADGPFEPLGAEGSPTEQGTSPGNPATPNWATYQYGRYKQYRRVYDAAQRQCRIEAGTVFADRRSFYNQAQDGAFRQWIYSQHLVNVGLLKNGSGWNNSFLWPIGPQGSPATIAWDGCIEERQTVSQPSYVPVPAGAKDLDIDSIPVAGDPSSQWAPVLGDLAFTRSQADAFTLNTVETKEDYEHPYYACPQAARKLEQWPIPTMFSSYVDSLFPHGSTYHDIGLLWGARLMSPTGIFASENATTPSGGKIERHMIFMTDGDAETWLDDYTAYGVNWFDRRTTPAGETPTRGKTEVGTLTKQVNARTEALCTAIKNKNITLWVITFGAVAQTTETRMTACATPGKYFNAKNATEIQSRFAAIANQISALRLTQ